MPSHSLEIVIDAHHHLWDPARARYPWLTAELGPINRPMAFAELAPQLAAAGIDRTGVVQAAEDDADTDYMLEGPDAARATGGGARHRRGGGLAAAPPAGRRGAAARGDRGTSGLPRRTLLHQLRAGRRV